jgi:hypothetical protein
MPLSRLIGQSRRAIRDSTDLCEIGEASHTLRRLLIIKIETQLTRRTRNGERFYLTALVAWWCNGWLVRPVTCCPHNTSRL